MKKQPTGKASLTARETAEPYFNGLAARETAKADSHLDEARYLRALHISR